MLFKEFITLDSLIQEFNSTKSWSAKKPEILQMWRGLRTDVPITIMPLTDKPDNSDSSTYGEDGIRITGSWAFISSVLSRLKELINYENPQSKLRLVLRSVNKGNIGYQSFVFYLNLEKRKAPVRKVI